MFEDFIIRALTKRGGDGKCEKSRADEPAKIKAVRKTVKKYAESHKISEELAEKFVLRDFAADVRDEAQTKIISPGSENWQKFSNLIEAVLDEPQKAELQKPDQPKFKPLAFEEIKVGDEERTAARQYIEKKYEGANPPDAVIAELAQMHKIFQALIERLSSLEQDLLAGEWNINKLLAERPEVFADIAKIQQTQQALFELEKRCDPRAEIEALTVQLEKQKHEALNKALWKPALDWLKAWPRAGMIIWGGGVFIGLPVAVLYLMAETGRLIIRTGFHGTKFLLRWREFFKREKEIKALVERPATA